MWLRTPPNDHTPVRPASGGVGLELVRERSADYNTGARGDVIPLLDGCLGRVLDVGCGTGAAADMLRARGATEIVGVELEEAAAAEARRRYDDVLVGSAEAPLPWGPARFDTVLCHDVLEHLYDPWTLLQRINQMLAPGGRLQISVPNVRHRSVVLGLLLRGTFSYAPQGLLDVTHVRFFTRSEMERALVATGFTVASVAVPPSSRPVARLIRWATRDRLVAFTTSHWFFLARPQAQPQPQPRQE